MNAKLANELNALMEQYPKNFRMGAKYGRGVLLRRPSFDCEWYWGLGYLGNSETHYHVDGVESDQYKHLFDRIKLHFGDSLTITDDKDLWTFCEIMISLYTLKATAELLYRGGSHTTTNPDKELLKNEEMYLHFVKVLIPAQIASLYAVLKKYA
jgi:hypothetical protein